MQVSHIPLSDPEINSRILNLLKAVPDNLLLASEWNNNNYFDTWRDWIKKSSCNHISGLEYFSHRAHCAGVMDAITNFVTRHSVTRRLRFSQSDFIGAKIVSNACGANWSWLEDADLDSNDALLISLPFAGNGDQHPNLEHIFDTCDYLHIPVFLDMAYFGISYGLNVDLDRTCITDVAFSLSKPFSTQMRLGLRFARHYNDDCIQSQSDLKIYNRISAWVAMHLMQEFTHDWMVTKYRPVQEAVCCQLGLQPTPTLTLALGTSSQHQDFYRNGYYRICITDEIQQRIQQ